MSPQPLYEGRAALEEALLQLDISRSVWVQPDSFQDIGIRLKGL